MDRFGDVFELLFTHILEIEIAFVLDMVEDIVRSFGFFIRLQNELAKADARLTSQKIERNALRLTVPVFLITASSAFGYFITVMFLFLLISIESSIRHMAMNWLNSVGNTSIANAGIRHPNEESDKSA